MNKVTIRLTSGRTMVFFNVSAIDKTTATVELSYDKKKGDRGWAIIPWNAIDVLYISEQHAKNQTEETETA